MLLRLALPSLRADKGLVLTAVENCPLAFQFASEDVKDDRAFALCAIERSKSGAVLQFMPHELQNDHAVVEAAVTHEGMALQFASEGLRRNVAVVSAAVRNDCGAFDYALGDEARGDKAMLLSAVSQVCDQ